MNRLAEIIAQYDAQGAHRTATPVDEASGQWLAAELQALGISSLAEPFETDRVNVETATLTIDAETIDGVPAFDCGYTDAAGITGRLGALGSDTEIGVAIAPPFDSAPAQQAILAARSKQVHRAIVVITDPAMPPGGAALVNAEHFRAPFGPPILQVGNDAAAVIEDAAQHHATATLVAHASRTRETALNIGGEIWGKQSDAAPLVVMTPRSGWWHCASERGGGIACLLLIASHFMANPPMRNIIFTANTGHELGHTGLDHFLARNADLTRNAHAWIHLGANFAAKNGSIVLQYGSTEVEELGQELVRDHRLPVTRETKAGTRPLGEARNIFDGGGNYLSILGGNPLFHHPADRWPDAVDMETASRCADFLIAAADQLANR